MKLISFAIPCYNSAVYMSKAIESVLVGGEDVEILIVNDGSSDETSKIAHEYEEKYPTIIKAIDKINGGHGDAVMTGLSYATGEYFKVVDSDDWLDGEALKTLLEKVREFIDEGKNIDMVISNYVYEKEGVESKKVIHYRNALPINCVFGWKDLGIFRIDQYILMHSVLYRTDLLRLCQLKLPKHTFYVDNIYVYYPLPFVRNLYYVNVDLYRYYIGREDQSVNEKVMIKRLDQQLYVTRCMIAMYDFKEIREAKLRRYMRSYLAVMMTICSILCVRAKTPEALEKRKDIWAYLKTKDKKTYLFIRHNIKNETMNLPGKAGRRVSTLFYLLARKVVGFN